MNEFQIEKLLTLTEENNIILKKMRRNQLLQSYMRIIYMIMFVISFYGGYVLIKPFYSQFLGIYQNLPIGNKLPLEQSQKLLELLR